MLMAAAEADSDAARSARESGNIGAFDGNARGGGGGNMVVLNR
jgi:hypothetical protein